MNNKQIAMLTAAALLLAWLAARRRKRQMMTAADMPPAMDIKEIPSDRPAPLQMPQTLSASGPVVPDNIVDDLRKPIPAARVPVEPLAQDYRTTEIVSPTRAIVAPNGLLRNRTILLSDI